MSCSCLVQVKELILCRLRVTMLVSQSLILLFGFFSNYFYNILVLHCQQENKHQIYPSYFGGLCLMQAQGAHISLEGIDIREWAVPVCLRPVVCPVSPLMSVNSHLLVPNLCCSTCCLGSSQLGFAV